MTSFVIASGLHPTIATTTLQIAQQRIAASWMWYVVRASGFTAAGLLILLMISGIGQVTGLTYRVMEPLKAWAVHRALAIALCVAVATHGLFLWLDHYVSFSLTTLLIPFTSHYRSTHLFGVGVGSLWVACGIFATYLIAITVASSLGWIDTHKHTWKLLHYLNYLVMVLVFFHALGVGSDLRYGTFRKIWIAIGFILLLAVISRLWRSGTLRSQTDQPH